jgi:DNA-binding response OmpR family regulator
MAKLIMVINDTEEILELFEMILSEEGYEVSLYSYQVRELDQVKKVNPDLLIVDQMIMDESPGWQLIQKMKMDQTTAKIPIVVCTAAINKIKELEGHLKEKNVQVVIKPFDIEELISAVKKGLGEEYVPPARDKNN